MGSTKSTWNEALFLMEVKEASLSRMEKVFSKLFKAGYQLRNIQDGLFLLRLEEGVESYPVFRASFMAIADDLGILKALAVPSDNRLFESYLPLVKEGTCTDLFALGSMNPAIYDECLPLVMNLKDDYPKTLRVYIENGCSSRRCQVELYMHFNTIEYRVRKCQELLKMNLGLFPTRMFVYELLLRVDCGNESI